MDCGLLLAPPLGLLCPPPPRLKVTRPRPPLPLSTPRSSYSDPDDSLAEGKFDNLISQVQSSFSNLSAEGQVKNHVTVTGSAYDFKGATSLTNELISPKKVTLVRHGLSSWNEENRVQGSSDLSILTDIGARQAERCRNALVNIKFDLCFSSPISRAKSTAELIWQGRDEPLIFLDSLKEAHLFFLEGMRNADAKKIYPELYATWREDPANFNVNGIYPIHNLWETAREAWKEILSSPGEDILVVTHKSILRALICTALGLGPVRFWSVDINNGGISVFTFNRRGEAMLQSLNMTAHINVEQGFRKGQRSPAEASGLCRHPLCSDCHGHQSPDHRLLQRHPGCQVPVHSCLQVLCDCQCHCLCVQLARSLCPSDELTLKIASGVRRGYCIAADSFDRGGWSRSSGWEEGEHARRLATALRSDAEVLPPGLRGHDLWLRRHGDLCTDTLSQYPQRAQSSFSLRYVM